LAATSHGHPASWTRIVDDAIAGSFIPGSIFLFVFLSMLISAPACVEVDRPDVADAPLSVHFVFIVARALVVVVALLPALERGLAVATGHPGPRRVVIGATCGVVFGVLSTIAIVAT